jgi:hypothetical protein
MQIDSLPQFVISGCSFHEAKAATIIHYVKKDDDELSFWAGSSGVLLSKLILSLLCMVVYWPD